MSRIILYEILVFKPLKNLRGGLFKGSSVDMALWRICEIDLSLVILVYRIDNCILKVHFELGNS